MNHALSDKAIVRRIGDYVKHHRLKQNITQKKAAEIAGVNRWTISQIENGEAVSLLSLIQILRALKCLDIFEHFLIEEEISPILLAKLEAQKRQRASSANRVNNNDSDEW